MKRTLARASAAAAAVLISLLVLFPIAVRAQVPQTISYQGSLTDSSGKPITASLAMTFGLYAAASGGAPLWQETQASVPVANGAFSVVFGADAGNPLGVSLFAGQLYLGIAVGADAEMTPRRALTAVGYAIQAKNAETLGGLQTSEIIDAAADEVRTPISALPFTIASSGSYYLTGDLALTSTTATGITVNADDVTIDLMGFSLIGPGSGTGQGVFLNGRSNIELRNGTVRGFGSHGIASQPEVGQHYRLVDLRVMSNGEHGAFLGNSDVRVKDCAAGNNAGNYGFYLDVRANISGSTAGRNGGVGIRAGRNSVVTGNTAGDNALMGIAASTGSTVTGNSAYFNGGHGISAGSAATISGNTAYQNGENGIHAFAGSTVTGNTAYFNQGYGIALSGSAFVDGNTAVSNNQSAGAFTNIQACATCTFGSNHAP